MLTDFAIGPETVVRVPASWDVFVFNGFLYRRTPSGGWLAGRWVAP